MLQSVIGVTGYDVAKFAVRADCGPSYCGAGRAMMWENLRCGLTAGQVTAGRGGAGCGLRFPARAGP